ncbi:hypothetical protein LUZ61_001706 [Rhynchospora tenuis]|uniref:DEK-C domain-containing protein n=1 Tax=Rhynchospora tenuis TaxID=198213 RepID=A0AAD5ZHQ9_9POAL|nr:hypothetical protein LUZ61_001706 [Rhynchospora tenuis]
MERSRTVSLNHVFHLAALPHSTRHEIIESDKPDASLSPCKCRRKETGSSIRDILLIQFQIGRKGDTQLEDYKKDVLQFSGFVPHHDEENQREKVKERLHKCTREMLAQLFSVFDICVGSAFYAMNKEKIIQLLLNFLEAPYDASEEAESFHKEMPSRKRKLETIEKSSEMDTSTSLEVVHEEDEEESKEDNSNATSSEPEEMRGSGKGKNSTVSETPKEGCLNLLKSVLELEKSNKNRKFTESRVAHGGDKPPKEWCDPSCEEVQNAISIILEKIDITTATFSDVLEELDEHFEMDMSPRKDAIKVMLEEGIYRLADDILEQEDHEENQEEKEEQNKDENEN